MAVMTKSTPKAFFRRSALIWGPKRQPRAAPSNPPSTAGRAMGRGSFDCFQRNTVATNAQGRKKSRFMARAMSWLWPMTTVSHRRRRLPPPTPRPDRKPRAAPTRMATIDIGSLPTGASPRRPGEARGWGSAARTAPPVPRPPHCPADRGRLPTRAGDLPGP